jgi:hypothetical protein
VPDHGLDCAAAAQELGYGSADATLHR